MVAVRVVPCHDGCPCWQSRPERPGTTLGQWHRSRLDVHGTQPRHTHYSRNCRMLCLKWFLCRTNRTRPCHQRTCSWQHMPGAWLVWHSHGKRTAVDVTVAHRWQVSERTATRGNWRTFLKRKETAKHAKYNTPCRNGGWLFATLALGTGQGLESAKLLSRIVKRITSWDQGDIRSTRQAESYQLLSIALFRWSLSCEPSTSCIDDHIHAQPPPGATCAELTSI